MIICDKPKRHIYISSSYDRNSVANGARGDVVPYSFEDEAGHYAELQGVLIYY